MKYEEIIKQFQDKYGYVKDLKKLFRFLQEENYSKEEQCILLKEVLDANEQVEKRISALLQKKSHFQKVPKTTEEVCEGEPKEDTPISHTRLLDCSHYLSFFHSSSDLDFLTDILPSSYDNNYMEMMYSILLHLYKEISCSWEMLKSTTDPEEKDYLSQEIAKFTSEVKLIKDYMREETTESEKEEEKEEEKNLIYLKNMSGAFYIESDLDEIEDLDLPFVESLFESVQNKRVFREKRFHSHEDLKGISAIRKGNVRIIFVRLSQKDIAVLGVFAKRFQNPSTYQELLKRRAKAFQEQKEEMLEKLTEDAFIEENQALTRQITEKIQEREKKKEKKK